MKNERRNDKEHQKQRLHAYREAQQVIYNLHNLAGNSHESRINVGQMVSLAATMGLLQTRERQPREYQPRERQPPALAYAGN
jgi:hypothetical protein